VGCISESAIVFQLTIEHRRPDKRNAVRAMRGSARASPICIRALAISLTQPSARDVETGILVR
jgi:hypothetical protein